MNDNEINEEIIRVKKALAKTASPYLRRDYEKHLRKLYRIKKQQKKGA